VNDELFAAIDGYIAEHLIPPDPALEEALRSSAAAGLPSIQVSPTQGKLLYLLARMQQAKRILEIGTLGGYSTIWLARALAAGGKLITLEAHPKHAEVARANIERAGLSERVEIRLGPALDSLAELARESAGPFDLIFIDADKPNNPRYLEWSVRLSRPGTAIVTDNVARHGRLLESDSPDADIQGTRRFFEQMGADRRLEATALQTVGSKGHDGFALALVK